MKFHFPRFANGENPAQKFLLTLSEPLQEKIVKKLELYAVYGFQYLIRNGDLQKFSDTLYEVAVLRNYRFMGTFIGGDCYLVAGFRKKTQRTPRRIIDYANSKIHELKNIN